MLLAHGWLYEFSTRRGLTVSGAVNRAAYRVLGSSRRDLQKVVASESGRVSCIPLRAAPIIRITTRAFLLRNARMPDPASPVPASSGASANGAFGLLGLPLRFEIEPRTVRAAWMQRAAAVHPDATGAAEESARVNAAYRTLVDPLARAVELLQLRQAPVVDHRALPEGFLLRMMELRERVDESREDPASIDALRSEAEGERVAALARLAEAFASDPTGQIGTEAAQAVWIEINVVRAFERMLEQLDREAGGT